SASTSSGRMHSQCCSAPRRAAGSSCNRRKPRSRSRPRSRHCSWPGRCRRRRPSAARRAARGGPGGGFGRSWRLVATALAFALLGVAAVIVNLVYFLPVRFLAPAGATRRRLARTGIRASYRAFLQLLALLGVVRFELEREALARLGAGGGVIVANHPT